ncbi:MAG: hypothetical protein ACOYLI_08465 [Synechococcus lacustris]
MPRGLVELYGLLAVLIVLVPEWLASGALAGFQDPEGENQLPAPAAAWRRVPELMLAALSFAQLRQLAHQEGLWGYGRQRRDELSERLLKRLRQKR